MNLVKDLIEMKILIVDDDSISQKVLKKILENAGYSKIQISNSGEEALDLIGKEFPDLILLDIFMPGIEGYEVCKNVRDNELTAHIPILMVTGGAAEADESIEKSFKAGATDFLTKPIRSIEFLSRVKASLTAKQKHDQFVEESTRRLQAEKEKEKLIIDLKQTLAQIKKMSGLFPICSYCKQIRDDKGYWNKIEEYIRDNTEADFSHSICPECAKQHHPDLDIYD